MFSIPPNLPDRQGPFPPRRRGSVKVDAMLLIRLEDGPVCEELASLRSLILRIPDPFYGSVAPIYKLAWTAQTV